MDAQGYLLDTSVLLETLKTQPNASVTHWMESVNQEDFYVSSLTIGEIVRALDNVRDADRRTALTRWVLTDLQGWFRGHILTFTPEVSAFWGTIADKVQGDVSVISGMQAAFAIKHNLFLVTQERISAPMLKTICPWDQS